MATFDSTRRDPNPHGTTGTVEAADSNQGGLTSPRAALDTRPDLPKKKFSWYVWMLITFGVMIMVALVLSFARTADAPMPTIDTSAQDAPNREVRGATPDTENTPTERAVPDAPTRNNDDDTRRGRQEPTQVAPAGR